MNKKFDLKIGDKVRIKGEKEFLTITHLESQKVRINNNKESIFTRVYFGIEANHPPIFDWNIEEKKNGTKRK